MAELKFQAPLATVESEEWNDFNDFQTAVTSDTSMKDSPDDSSTEKVDTSVSDNFGVCETYSGSLQDLVHSLDEKITKCFCNYEDKVEQFAPVQIRSQEEIMSDCQMWWTITGNFGSILPIDWSKSYARQLQTKALNLGERKEPESQNLDLSDDEELAQAMDFHSMLTNHHPDPDHVATADEVISELESMMEDPNADRRDSVEVEYPDMTISPYTKVKESLQLPSYTAEELKALSHTALNEVLNDYELTIKELSETLVQELALRDELEYDKELKNQFISLLLTIQKKRRETNVDKKKRRSKNHVNNYIATSNNSLSPSADATMASIFLTTVIPYHPNQGPPTSEQLQIYIKILQAINEDSPTVPTLLTDYILKVLCPT